MHAHLVFDLLAWAVAFGTGYAVWRWRLKGVDQFAKMRWSRNYLIALAGGAILGAFYIGSINLWLSGEPGLGRSIAGALLGAIIAIETVKRVAGIRGGTGLYYAAPLAMGILVGRIGCYLSGLEDFTYGTPTDGPFGVDFGDGVLRHPVQLYEAGAMALFLAAYISALALRSAFAMQYGFYLFIGWYGLERFVLEFFKPYASVVGPFNLFHFVCAALVLYAGVMIRRRMSEAAGGRGDPIADAGEF